MTHTKVRTAVNTLRYACAAALLLGFSLRCSAAPVVRKVEPPNWWVGMPNPMLLLSGENLGGARVKTAASGVRVVRAQAEATGNYLFVWLDVDPSAKPGPVHLELQTAQGSAVVPFSLQRRKSAGLRFSRLAGNDVIYLLMPDRFADGDPANDSPPQSPGTYDRARARAYHGGDLRGIRDHLPYLRDLGVTTLWITPIVDNDTHSPGDYHGYGAVDMYAVDEHLGTLAELQELVVEAHQQNIRVFLDFVANHLGPKHPWVNFPPEPGWFHGTAQNHVRDGAFAPLADPHAAPRLWRNALEGWFADILPDLNQENPHVARYIEQNALWWIEEGSFDGFRLDTFPYVSRKFWSEFHREIRRVYPDFPTIGEVFYPDPAVTSFFAGGQAREGIDSGVSTVFDFPFQAALRNVILRGAPASDLMDVLRRDWLYPHSDRLVTFLGNHDQVRFMSEPGSSIEKLKLAFSVLLTTRGNPQIYSGDEIGMRGGEDPDNRRDFPGGFPGDPRNAFTAEGRTAEQQEVFAHVQKLLRLRRQHEALRTGKQWHIDVGKDFYAYMREAGPDRLLIVFNNSERATTLRLAIQDTPLTSAREFHAISGAPPARLAVGEAELTMEPRSLAIYEVK